MPCSRPDRPGAVPSPKPRPPSPAERSPTGTLTQALQHTHTHTVTTRQWHIADSAPGSTPCTMDSSSLDRRPPSSRTRRNQYDAAEVLACAQLRNEVTRCNGIDVHLCEQEQHTFNGPLSGTIRVSRYQKGTTNLNFTEARDSEWQWHQLGRMQVCTSLQADNHASTSPRE